MRECASARPGASVEDAPPPHVVRSAQELLTELGYAPGPADGIWGRRSAEAYRAFLRDAGMPSENALTPEALLVMRAIAERHDGRPDTGAFPIADSLDQALLQQAILEAQELLEILGYRPGPADGVWGRRSAEAYRAFLRAAGLPPEDALTPDGLRALRVRAGSQVAADADDASLAGDAAPQDAVREAQELLAALGYDPGPADGDLGHAIGVGVPGVPSRRRPASRGCAHGGWLAHPAGAGQARCLLRGRKEPVLSMMRSVALRYPATWTH